MKRNRSGWRSTLARWIALGWEDEPYRPPEKRTWAEKVTDGSNAWLTARRFEREGDLAAAARAYAEDAEFWRRQGHLARAAISTASYARCAGRVGNNGVAGFEAAGDLFLEAAERTLPDDPSAALQLFERAAECFRHAGAPRKAAAADETVGALREALDPAATYG